MRKLKIIALILALITLASTFVACKKDEDEEKVTSDSTNDLVVSTEPSDTEEVLDVEDDLPETMDFGGRVFNILARVEGNTKNNEITAESASGNNVDSAVYQRNLMIQDRLNCVINPIIEKGTLDTLDVVNDKVYQNELSGAKEYDLCAAMSSSMVALAYQGCLTNLNGLQYVNTQKDYWSDGFREALSVGDTQYFVTGPMSLSYYRYMFVTLFNQDLFNDNSQESLYDVVERGEWTIEKMEQIASNFYFDFNGNGDRDKDDSYGYYTHVGSDSSMMDGFWECFGLRIVQKGEVEGFGANYYTYDFEAENFVNAIDGVIKLIKSEGSFAATSPKVTLDEVTRAFKRGQAAMITVRLLTVEQLTEMKDGYGIVPLPKMNSVQEDYATSIQAECLLFAIPNTVNEVEEIGALLECFGSTGYKTVRPAYYDKALTGRYARDPQSVANLDLIAHSVFVDPINYYRTFTFNRETIRGLYVTRENTISSTVARCRSEIKTNIDTINQHYYDVSRAQSAA